MTEELSFFGIQTDAVADCCLEDYRDRKLENVERQADDLDETDNGDNILALAKKPPGTGRCLGRLVTL